MAHNNHGKAARPALLAPMPEAIRPFINQADYTHALTFLESWGFVCPECGHFEEGYKGTRKGQPKAIAAYRRHLETAHNTETGETGNGLRGFLAS